MLRFSFFQFSFQSAKWKVWHSRVYVSYRIMFVAEKYTRQRNGFCGWLNAEVKLRCLITTEAIYCVYTPVPWTLFLLYNKTKEDSTNHNERRMEGFFPCCFFAWRKFESCFIFCLSQHFLWEGRLRQKGRDWSAMVVVVTKFRVNIGSYHIL